MTTTYIALLRGINVGGHRVSMDALRQHFAALGLQRVRTYIQTGNVFFDAPADLDRTQLTARIEQHLREALGYAVPTFLRTTDELAALLALDVFGPEPAPEAQRRCLMLLAQPAPPDLALPHRSPKGEYEIVHLSGQAAFVVWHLQDGRPPSSTAFLDKTLGKLTTTRFVHTAAKILEAARQ
ncbi:DUF1697 domain-containing protein [Hymenobacter sp. 15J16-1T3B]|uniref:DUF1697 domain-containing protein n=1 Tax=Hymenobacter sp. 15J16-1T3B TaxID=2886941 RepID=UPI001D0FE89C|nr:DUF1697 domain-containing protein [Hymenobacter sp. 15J16-1T3B]MCC3156577.1 DUF1697 domain-containing protein [Hymenobacter sp. 15J16-1T3B]